jgi:hypothetical protein
LEILLVSPEISLTSVVKCFGIVVVEWLDFILLIKLSAALLSTSSRSRQQWEDGWKTQDKSKKHIHEQPTSGNPPYSPSRPSMEDQKVQLASLNFCSSGNSVPYITVPVRSSHRLTASLVLNARIVSWSVGLINLA